MTEYYVRPGPNDLAPYASGANDGSSYTNAFRGLNNATFRTLVNTTSDDVFWICGEHAALQSGTTTYRFPVAPGLSRRNPKIFRLDYPGDPGTIWGGYISTATWTETAGGSRIWTATMLVTAASYDDEGTCPYAVFFNGAERRILARRATQGECDSEENTFYLTGTTCRVHLGAGEDPNGNKIMLAQYGHRIQYMRSDTHMKHVYFHGGAVHPLGRLAMTDGSGLFLTPRNVTWNGQKILHGATHLFPLRRTRNLTVKNAEVGKLAGHGAFYAYITTVDDFGTTLAGTEARRPEYNNKNLRIENTKLHTIGVYSRQDGHLVGLQAIEMFTLRGADLSWAPSAFVMWHSNEPVCRCSEIHLSYVGMHHIWSGEGAAATTAKPLRAFATESGTHQDADFSNRTLEYFWIGGIAGVGVEPLHPQIGLRMQNNNPNGHFIVQHGKVVDTPCAVVMPQNAPYLYYDDIEVIDPAGHSTHNIYATVEANQWTTAHADNFTFSGLADSAQSFALRGLTAETVALTTYLSQATVTDAGDIYRFFGASTFGAANLSPLTVDFGEDSAAGVIVAEAAGDGVFSITAGNSSGYFAINSTTGEITLHASGVGNLSGSYVLTRHDDVANTNQQITVNIKPNAITVDAAHPLTDTVGTDSYSWTLPKPTTCFQFADGTWAAVPPAAGQSITAFSPAPISRTVTDYDGSSGSKAVDGAQVMGSWAFSAVDQGIDQRQPHFVTGLRPTAPVSLAAGYKLLTMKSLDTPPTTGGDVAQAMRKSCLSSAHVVTALNAVPVDMTKKYYRPGLFHDTSQVSTATLIPQFDVTTSWPTLASPTAVDMSGNAVTLDFSELEAELVYYDPAGALGLFRNYQVPGDAIYEAWGTRHQAWKTHGAAASAYNFDRFLLWRFIRQRVNKTSDAAAQAIIDEIIQYTLDWDSLIEKAKAASLTSLNVGWPHGGHVNCVAHVLVIGAWALMTIGGATATTIATRVYNRLIQDSPDFMPVTQRQWWVNSKEVNASNRATCNFYDRTGTLATATAPVTTVNFGAIDWKAAGLTEQTSNDRIPQGMLGLQFQITSGSAQGFYMVVGWTFDENSWNGIGGDGWVVSPNWTNRTPPSPGDTFKFLVATTEALDWCADAFGGPLVGHNTDAYLSNAYIGNTFHGTFFPRLAGSYSPQNMPQQRSAYIAMYGLTCALWANGAETLTPNARTKWFWERARSIGHTAYSWNCNSTYDIWNPSIEALHRHYLHGGNGHRDWDLYPAVKDTTVPTLSSLSGDASTFNFTTNYPFHRAYWVVTTSATQPTAAQIRAGQDHTGAAASLSGSVSINTAGTKTIGHSLTPGTYYLHVVQDTPSGYSSAVTSSSAVVVAAYSPSFITFDGGDYATKNGLAIVGGDYGMLRFAFRAPNTAGPILSMGPDGWSDRIRISWNANGMVGVRVRTDGGGYVFEDQIFSGLTPNTIYDCVVAWDSVADVARWLLNGSTTSTFYHWGGTLLGSTNTVGRIGANRDGGIFVGDLSIVQVWMNLPSMPDLTNATLQALFYSGGASKDPAALESVVGASDISFWGNAANFNAGHINPFSDPSSLWSVTGAVVDA